MFSGGSTIRHEDIAAHSSSPPTPPHTSVACGTADCAGYGLIGGALAPDQYNAAGGLWKQQICDLGSCYRKPSVNASELGLHHKQNRLCAGLRKLFPVPLMLQPETGSVPVSLPAHAPLLFSPRKKQHVEVIGSPATRQQPRSSGPASCNYAVAGAIPQATSQQYLNQRRPSANLTLTFGSGFITE